MANPEQSVSSRFSFFFFFCYTVHCQNLMWEICLDTTAYISKVWYTYNCDHVQTLKDDHHETAKPLAQDIISKADGYRQQTGHVISLSNQSAWIQRSVLSLSPASTGKVIAKYNLVHKLMKDPLPGGRKNQDVAGLVFIESLFGMTGLSGMGCSHHHLCLIWPHYVLMIFQTASSDLTSWRNAL